MQAHYRDLLKHSSIYGLGQVVGRLTSFLLLPLYTRYLEPADYGCIAILDLTVNLLSILIGSGMAAAVNRYHFEARDEAERDRVWWSGLSFLALMATAVVISAWLARDVLARTLLGPDVAHGGFYYSLALPTLWFNCVCSVPEIHLRARKWSGVSVGLALGRLLVNVALNVVLLVSLRLGVAGLLWGNLITAVITAAAQFAIFLRTRGPLAVDWGLLFRLWWYGWPLVVNGLLMAVMYQSDRYLLRVYGDMGMVGIYSLAVAFGNGINSFYFDPFKRIWDATLYEVAGRPEADQVFADVFRYTVCGGLLVILGMALFSRPVLGVLVAQEYATAANLIPIIGLSCLCIHTSSHFNVPVRLSRSTLRLVPAIGVTIAISIVLNMAIIPRFGPTGAACTAVASYASYAAMCLALSRSLRPIAYPFAKCGTVALAMGCAYLAYRLLAGLADSMWADLSIAVLIWSCAAGALGGPFLRRLAIRDPLAVRRRSPSPARRAVCTEIGEGST